MEIKKVYQIIAYNGTFNSRKLHRTAEGWGFRVNGWVQGEVDTHTVPPLTEFYKVKATFDDIGEARAAFAAEHTYVSENGGDYAFKAAALQQVILGRESSEDDWEDVFEVIGYPELGQSGDWLDYSCDVSELLDKWKADEEQYRKDEQEFKEFLGKAYPNN